MCSWVSTLQIPGLTPAMSAAHSASCRHTQQPLPLCTTALRTLSLLLGLHLVTENSSSSFPVILSVTVTGFLLHYFNFLQQTMISGFQRARSSWEITTNSFLGHEKKLFSTRDVARRCDLEGKCPSRQPICGQEHIAQLRSLGLSLCMQQNR